MTIKFAIFQGYVYSPNHWPKFASYEKTMILLNLIDISVTKYSRMDKVKFVKDTDFQKFEVIWSALSL